MNRKSLHMFSMLIVVLSFLFLLTDYAMAGKTVPAPYVPTGFPQVVVVSGTNFEMGKQYAEQTAAAIVHNLAIMKSKLYDKYGGNTVTADMKVWDYYTRIYDPGLVEWLQGIQAGCKAKGYNISYLDTVILMVYPSENWARPWERPYPAETKIKPSGASTKSEPDEYHSCNSFAATASATTDHQAIHGLLQMVAPEAMDTVIFLAFPTNGPSWVSQPYSGRVNGNSGMNSAGFAWTLTAISQWSWSNPAQADSYWGLITEVYFHYLAQIATTANQAIDYLKNTPRAGVTGGITMSDKEGVIQTFECNHDVWALRTPSSDGNKDFIVMTNHLVTPAYSDYNPPWAAGSQARYTSVKEFIEPYAAAGEVNFDIAKKLFEANYDFGSTVNQSIYHASDLTAYLQTGTPTGNGMPPHATGEYVKIRLATDPKTVAGNAGADAWEFYSAAAISSGSASGATWFTADISNEVAALLDQALAAWVAGDDRASWASLQKKQSPQLWAEALTCFAKAQLYSQMAATVMKRAQGL